MARVRTTQDQPAVAPALSMDVETELALGNVLSRLNVGQGRQTIGRYELGDQLGAGGFGAVYVAHDPSLDRDVAIKVVLPRGREANEAQARLVREAKALAKLGHPNVVEVFDVGVQVGQGRRGDRVYIVMELLGGPTLGSWVLEDQPAVPEIVEVYAAAADGLAAAHSVGVVHRDFKPANAMLGADRGVKVLDFGLAREDLTLSATTGTGGTGGSAESEAQSSFDSLTRTGTVMGTPRYMSPQQHDGKPGTAACDQYAVCASLWEAVVGRPPFEAVTLIGLATAKDNGPPPRPEAIPAGLYAVLRRGLAVDPDRRWSTMSELAAQLRSTATRSSRRRWPWAAGAALLFAGAGAAWASAESEPEPPAVCVADRPDRTALFEHVVERTRAADTANIKYHPRVRTRLARFERDFAEARTQVCAAESDNAGDSVARAECLQRADETLATLVDGREALEPSHLARRMLSLPRPVRCVTDDPSVLYRRTAAQEDELDDILDNIPLSKDAPSPQAHLRRMDERIARTKALSDHYSTAWLLQKRNAVALKTGRADEVARNTQEAVWVAEQAQDYLLATEIMPVVLATMVDAGRSDEELEAAFARAERLLEQAGQPGFGVAGLCASASLRWVRRGKLSLALEYAQRGLAAAGDPPAPQTLRHVGLLLLMQAAVHAARQEIVAAKRSLDQIIAMAPRDVAWGQGLLAPALRMRGEIAAAEGDYDAYLAGVLEERELTRTSAGPEHPNAVYIEAQIGHVLSIGGWHEQGLARIVAAHLNLSDNSGELNLLLTYSAKWVVEAALVADKPDVAIEYGGKIVELTQSRTTDNPVRAEDAYGFLLAGHVAAGDFEAAAKIVDKTPDLSTQTFNEVRVGRGRLALAQGRPAEATAEALAVLKKLAPDKLSAEHNVHRVAAYELLADIATAEAREDDARSFEVMAAERRPPQRPIPVIPE